LRPFVPRLWKNGPLVSILPFPEVLWVADRPLELMNGNMSGIFNCGCASLVREVKAATAPNTAMDAMRFFDRDKNRMPPRGTTRPVVSPNKEFCEGFNID